MNGVHDMGGMQNFGPVVPEHDEARFHADWERRAFALTLAMGGTRMWSLDQTRAARESLPPAQYLGSSYYRIWIEGLSKLILEKRLVIREELADGRMRIPPIPTPGILAAEGVAAALARGKFTQRSPSAPARFGVGDAVRTRVINIPTHTRLPRYCRGKQGTIGAVHGSHVFPDTNALGEGEQPQWLYTVRFDAVELWGPDTTAAAVHADCWESYLEAPGRPR
jgi:nitrile hydratase beta subunit